MLEDFIGTLRRGVSSFGKGVEGGGAKGEGKGEGEGEGEGGGGMYVCMYV